MYKQIRSSKSLAEDYAERLVKEEVIDKAEVLSIV